VAVPPLNTPQLISRAVAAGIIIPNADGSVTIDDKGNPRFRRLLDQLGVTDQVVQVLSGSGVTFAPHSDTRFSPTAAHLHARTGVDYVPGSLDPGHVPVTTDPDLVKGIGLFQARRKIAHYWEERGGPLSPFGLPVGANIQVRPVEGGYRAQFRSGDIGIRDDGEIEPVPGDWIRVYWVGLECVIRQEGTDEIYGTVFCHVPGRAAQASVVQFPGHNQTIPMGPPGSRMIAPVELLYEGPYSNLAVGATLIENDSGDVEEISAEIASKIAELTGAAAAGAVGLPAEAVTDQTWYEQGLGLALGWLLDGVFGIGDDPYPPAAKLVLWQDLKNRPEPMSYARPGESTTISAYHEVLTLSGVDDGGDRGEYRVFFLFEHANNPG
jgi:hypothetical protein